MTGQAPATQARHTSGAGHNGLITLVVPAKDEAGAIGPTLRSLPLSELHAKGFDTEVVVLDGNSQDGTAEIARRLGASVIRDREDGKGSALRAARPEFHGDYIVMLDADGSYAVDAIPPLMDALVWGDADIVMGQRQPQPGSMTPIHRFGNKLLSLEASFLYGRSCPDVCTGLWGFRAEALQGLPLQSRGFELEADLFAMASRLGLRIRSVPVDYLPRTGDSKLNGARDGLRIGWWLMRSRFAPLADARRGPVQHRPPRPRRKGA